MCSPSETIDIPSIVGHAESQADHPLARSTPDPASSLFDFVPVYGDKPLPLRQGQHAGAGATILVPKAAPQSRKVFIALHPSTRAVSAPPEVGASLAGGSEGPGASPEVGVLLAGGAARASAAVRVRTSSERPDTATATRPDSCQESAKFGPQLKARDGDIVEIVVTPPEGRPTFRAAYFFSGESRRSSVGEELKALAIAKKCNLIVHEIDILNGGAQHDLLDHEAQSRWEARIESGEFDLVVLTPPCSSWTRSLFQPGGHEARVRHIRVRSRVAEGHTHWVTAHGVARLHASPMTEFTDR